MMYYYVLLPLLGIPILTTATTTTTPSPPSYPPPILIPTACHHGNCTDDVVFCHGGARWLSIEKWHLLRDIVVVFDQHVPQRTFMVAAKDEWTLRAQPDPVNRLHQPTPPLHHVLRAIERIVTFSWLTQASVDDYRCHKHECRFTFSAYDKACIRMTKPLPSKLDFKVNVEYRSDIRNVLVVLFISLAILYFAPFIAHQPLFFYVSGGTVGIFFALSVLVLIFFRTSRPQEAPRASHYSVALLVQSLAYYFRTSLVYVANEYFEFIALYVVVSFFLSAFLVHWLIKRPDGTTGVNVAMLDIAQVCILCFAIMLGAYALPSPRHGFMWGTTLLAASVSRWFGIFSVFALVGLEEPGNKFSSGVNPSTPQSHRIGSERRQRMSVSERANVLRTPERTSWYTALLRPFSTPRAGTSQRRLLTEEEYIDSGRRMTARELERLKHEPAFQEWIENNLTRITVSRLEEEDDDNDEEDTVSEEGEGSSGEESMAY